MSIRIYLGTQLEQTLATAVLSYSIRRHTSQPVHITPLYEAVAAAGLDIPVPKDRNLRPRTPFTFQRFAIPALCQYQGKAIYLDSDMLVFQDISELWQQPFDRLGVPTADLLSVPEPPESGRSPQYSVMLINCAQLKWNAMQLVQALERGRWTYSEFVLNMSPAAVKRADLPFGWNDLERYDPARTALLHYTDMPAQPWLSVANPLAPIWCAELIRAIADGAITRETVQDSVDRGWVRPSLMAQVDRAIADPQQLPAAIIERDRYTFVPPHIWQRYLRSPALQRARVRQGFSRLYAVFKAIATPTFDRSSIR